VVKKEIASLESQLATVRAKMSDHLEDLGLLKILEMANMSI